MLARAPFPQPVCFIVAWDAEAKPLIARWNLRRARQHIGFPLYTNEGVWLVRSGLGKDKAAQATTTALTALALPPSCRLINLGTAGHGTLSVGTVVIANEIVDGASGASWALAVPASVLLPCTTVITVEQPEETYDRPAAYDMEASGFVAAALALHPPEHIFCIKLVSDNPLHPVGRLTPQTVTALVTTRLAAIEEAVTRTERI